MSSRKHRVPARACPAAVSAARPHASPAVPPPRRPLPVVARRARARSTTTPAPVGSRVGSGALPAADHAALVPTEPALVVSRLSELASPRGAAGAAAAGSAWAAW